MDKRFQKNLPTLTEDEQMLLGKKRVLVAGCGGLGGYIIEMLARVGIGSFTLVDRDCFSVTNINRQTLATEETIGHSKVLIARHRIQSINPYADICAIEDNITEENVSSLLEDCDLVIDGLDNISSRLLLENACTTAHLPMIHGAVHGWSAQIAVINPGVNFLHRLYTDEIIPANSSVLSPIPAMCAAIQCAEAVKILIGKPPSLIGKLLYFDLETMDWTTIELQ